ncbi:MAG: histidinol-phosphate transaminase [bacterium]
MNFQKILLRENIRDLIPYSIEDYPYKIKLDANESPYSINWSLWPEVAQELQEIQLNRYPDPQAKKLKNALSSYLNWPEDKMILGNGSDELIQYILMAFGDPNRPVYAPHPTFSMYRIISISMGMKFKKIPLEKGFELPFNQQILTDLNSQPQKILFIATPNNPTGNFFNRDHVLDILKNTNGMVCIDEAYRDFCDEEGFLNFLPEFENLIILRTLSKMGLAGLRVGILLANEGAISAISKVRLPYNLNVISQFLAHAVLNHRDLLFKMISKIKENRSWLEKEMRKIKGIKIFPSQANFILFSCEFDLKVINSELLSEGILVRVFPPEDSWPGFIRVTIGTRSECEMFIQAVNKILSSKGKK